MGILTSLGASDTKFALVSFLSMVVFFTTIVFGAMIGFSMTSVVSDVAVSF